MSAATVRRLALSALLVAAADGGARAQFVNGSFETGDFSGWVTHDLSDPGLVALQVGGAGINNGLVAFSSSPTDGSQCAVTGFDGNGPGTIFIAQDVTIPAAQTTLLFDYGGGWDLVDFATATLNRTFSVNIEPAGGGSVMQSSLLQTAVAGTVVDDTGLITGEVDLSAFKGQTVRVKFAWFVPEDFSGPAICQLDHVRLVGKKLAAADASTLKVGLDLAVSGSDTISLDVRSQVLGGFDTTGQAVHVTVGDLVLDFTLDSKGKATVGSNTLKVSPPKGTSTLRKVSLRCQAGDFLADLSPYGLSNTTTVADGVLAQVPVTVLMDGFLYSRSLPVVYKATIGVAGAALGKAAPEKRTTKLSAKLDFITAANDTLTLKSAAVVPPLFTLDGTAADVSIGSLTRSFTLDATGQGSVADATLVLKRDKKIPCLYALTLLMPQASLANTLDADGYVNANVPKPGNDVPIQVQISIDGRITQVFLDTTWIAALGKSGTANGTF